MASSGSIIIQTSLVKLSTLIFGRDGFTENLFMISGIGLAAIINYLIYSRVIWKVNKKIKK